MLTEGALLSGADSFGDGFWFSVLLHMDKEYAQKWFHVKGILFPGSLFALALGLLVGAAVAVIK